VLEVGHGVGDKLLGPRRKAVADIASSTGLQLPLEFSQAARELTVRLGCSRTASVYSAPKGTFCATV
jgi:hypothetical protein